MAKKNTNKAYGCRKEREARQKLLTEGARYVLRARGSLGFIDLLAVFETYTKWISVKAGSDVYLKACVREWRDNPVLLPPYHIPQLWMYHKTTKKWEVVGREE